MALHFLILEDLDWLEKQNSHCLGETPSFTCELPIFASREAPTITCARAFLGIQVKTLLYSHLKKGVLQSEHLV